VQPPGFHADMFEEVLEECEFASCVVITFQVMAVSGVSPRDPDAVGSVTERCEDELGTHPGGTWNTNNADVGGILEAAHACQIRRSVTAPVAQKRRYLGFPISHCHLQKKRMKTVLGPLSFVYCRSEEQHHIATYHTQAATYISFIIAMICPSSNPFRLRAPDRHEETQRPQPLQRTGLISALPAKGPFWIKAGAE